MTRSILTKAAGLRIKTMRQNCITLEMWTFLFLNGLSASLALRENRSFASSSYNYTSFLPQLITCQASQSPLIPTSLTELQLIVQQAIKERVRLKAVGNLHSATDIICTSGVPVSMKEIDHFLYDSTTGEVTAGAGLTILNFLDKLHNHGRTLLGVPTYGEVTIGGSLGVGAHGSGRLNEPGMIADQIISLLMIDGSGNVRNISEPAALQAFKANLGLLGIVYEVVFATVPQHKLQIKHFPNEDKILWEDNSQKIFNYVRTSNRFQLWWFPTANNVVLSVGNRVTVNTSGLCETHFLMEAPLPLVQTVSDAYETMQEDSNHLGMFAFQAITERSLFMRVPGRTPIFSEHNNLNRMCYADPPTGFSHRMVSNSCKVCAWDHKNVPFPAMEFSVAVPLQEFHGAVMTIREILEEYPIEFPQNGIFIRFLSRSDGLLTINEGRETAVIEYVMPPRKDRYRDPMMGIAVSQAMMQALITNHRGRAHWSKNGLFYSSQKVVQKSFPEFSLFLKMMEDFDPNGVFLNEFGERLRFGSNRTSVDNWVEHCAIVDNCICEHDKDCGPANVSGSLRCRELRGFRVCRQNPEEAGHSYDAFRERVIRNFIKTL